MFLHPRDYDSLVRFQQQTIISVDWNKAICPRLTRLIREATILRRRVREWIIDTFFYDHYYSGRQPRSGWRKIVGGSLVHWERWRHPVRSYTPFISGFDERAQVDDKFYQLIKDSIRSPGDSDGGVEIRTDSPVDLPTNFPLQTGRLKWSSSDDTWPY